mmetsp:Transcript_22116/g.41214  ORF Transcript_22116/g.41214 Transcript_22116/m.41214 type:complete len:227 (-) Transcript_22116:262-942(-)
MRPPSAMLKLLLSAYITALAASICPRSTAFIGQSSMIKNKQKRFSSTIFGSFGGDAGADDYDGGDHFSMKELEQRIAELKLTNPFHDVLGDVWGRPKPSDVYVILFNPNTEEEGVHTVEYPRGSGNDVILAFESQLECEQFSSRLKDQNFFDPFTQEVKLDFLEKYCKSLGVLVQVVPEGLDIRYVIMGMSCGGRFSSVNHPQQFLFLSALAPLLRVLTPLGITQT